MFIRCDNIADGLSDPSPMLTDIRNWKESITDAMAMHRWAFSIFNLRPVRRQQNKSDLLFINDLIKEFGSHKVCGSIFHILYIRSLHLSYTLQKALCHRHDFVKTSPQHRQDITLTALMHARYLSVQGIQKDIFLGLSHASESPTITDSQNTSLTVNRCSVD